MSTPSPLPYTIPVAPEIPCCSPATTESVAVVRDKVADTRADVLVGQGHITKTIGDNTSAVLRDANGNALFTNANIDRSILASMSQTDKYGLANLNATRETGDKVSANIDRASYGLGQDIQDTKDKVTGQATTIAWAQENSEGRRFGESRAQVERINDAQSAYSDRAFKYQGQQTADSFARLSAQGEAGFYRTREAVGVVDRDVLKSEAALGRELAAGFANTNNGIQASYARLSEQHCDLKSAIAAAQAAAAECCCEVKQEVLRTGKELGLQAAQNFGAIQVEASKNTGAIQLQAAVNQKESLLEQSKWFALAEKTAMVNKCELADKLAECCCEIKGVVSSTAKETQQLITAQEAARVRDALSAATNENLFLRLRREEPHHYPHPYYAGPPRGDSR